MYKKQEIIHGLNLLTKNFYVNNCGYKNIVISYLYSCKKSTYLMVKRTAFLSVDFCLKKYPVTLYLLGFLVALVFFA